MVPWPVLVRASCPLCSPWASPGWRFEPEFSGVCTLWRRGVEMEERETHREEGQCSDQKWKARRGTLIDSCLAWCLLRLFPPSTAIISRRTSPSPWQSLCHPSPLEDAIPFGRRWIGVPSPCMRSLWTESLQREHSGVNRLYVNTSISDISAKNMPPHSNFWTSNSWVSNWSYMWLWKKELSKLLSSLIYLWWQTFSCNDKN